MHRVPTLLCSGFESQDLLPALQTLTAKAAKPLLWGPDAAWTQAAQHGQTWIWENREHSTGDPHGHAANTQFRPALEKLLAQHQPDLIILLTAPHEAALPLAQALGATPLFPGQEAGFVLQNLIHIADLDNLTVNLRSGQTLLDDDHAHSSRTLGEAGLSNLEISNTVLWGGSEKTFAALLPALAPQAHVAPYNLTALAEATSQSPFALSKTMEAPGWFRALRGHSQATAQVQVFRSRRPFHPARWKAVADAGWPGLVRLRGFVWLATQMKFIGQWIRAGASWNVEPSGIWWADMPQERWPSVPAIRQRIIQHWQEPWGDRRQELALIGEADTLCEVIKALEQALLTEEEMALGQLGWRYLYDPVHNLVAQGSGEGPLQEAKPDPSLAEAVHSVHFPQAPE